MKNLSFINKIFLFIEWKTNNNIIIKVFRLIIKLPNKKLKGNTDTKKPINENR